MEQNQIGNFKPYSLSELIAGFFYFYKNHYDLGQGSHKADELYTIQIKDDLPPQKKGNNYLFSIMDPFDEKRNLGKRFYNFGSNLKSDVASAFY